MNRLKSENDRLTAFVRRARRQENQQMENAELHKQHNDIAKLKATKEELTLALQRANARIKQLEQDEDKVTKLKTHYETMKARDDEAEHAL